MTVTVLDDIPFTLDLETVLNGKGLCAEMFDMAAVEQMCHAALDVARPKALYRECFVEARGEDTVTFGGATFRSRTMRRNLDAVERVFCFVCTCGSELDEAGLDGGDPMLGFLLDAIKARALAASRSYLLDHLTRRYALGKTAAMSPGSGDATIWPIEQQRELFCVLGDVHASIGVTLTESCLMHLNKTVSGIRFPTEVDFRTCQVCHRANCPSRSAPLDQQVWDAVHGE
jgi:hypothetical protein